MTITAISKARNNAELILEVAVLGYLREGVSTLDPTYGKGRFWKFWHPGEGMLTASDLDVAKSPIGRSVDFTRLDEAFDDPFEQIVFDGPYKLNGTSTGEGPSASDVDYGVDGEARSWQERHDLLRRGITSCVNVLAPRGMLLVKCQDQVCSGAVRWQTREFADHAESIGCTLVDMLHLVGGRKQPEGRTKKCSQCNGTGILQPLGAFHARCEGTGKVLTEQQHAARNYSTLLIFRGPK